MRKGRIPFILAFLLPPLAFYVVFVVSPFAQGIQISLTDWTGLTPDFRYIGLYNYEQLLADEDWWHAVANNVRLLLVLPITTITLALVFASLLTRGGTGGTRERLAGAGFYRVLFFIPQIMPAVIVAVMFKFVYEPENGLLHHVLRLVGVNLSNLVPNGLLGTRDLVLWAIMFAAVWAAVGFFMVLFIAGMQQIPRELFEAAAIDGAGRMRMFFSVTLPLLWNHVQVSLVYIGISTLDMFALIAVMTRTGQSADFGADVMATKLFRTGILSSDFGTASAMGTMMLIFSVFLALVTFRITRRERIEY